MFCHSWLSVGILSFGFFIDQLMVMHDGLEGDYIIVLCSHCMEQQVLVLASCSELAVRGQVVP